MELVGKNNCFSTYLAMFLMGTILLFFRSAYSFITPFLFNEDGGWFAQLINNGFIHTFFHQRYFMTGNLILVEVSIWINELLFGYNLRYLTEIFVVVSYSFHSIVALTTFICLRQNLKIFPRYLIWLLILLMPMGHSGHEVFGRTVNFCFMYYFIALVLTFYLIFNVTANTSKLKLIAIYLMLWVCSTTNSASNLIIAVGFCTDIYMQFLKLRKSCKYPNLFDYLKDLFVTFKNIMWVTLGTVCVICFLYQAFAMQLLTGGSIPHIIKHESIIEFFGRAVLFYFTWPFYNYLNDVYVILMLGLYSALTLVAVFVTRKEKRIEVIYLTIGTLAIVVSTLAMRSGLTEFLHGYQSTYPDRYFYVINLSAMLSIVYAVSCFTGSMTLKFCKFYIYILLVWPIIYSPSSVFEYNKFNLTLPFDSFPFEVFKGQNLQNGFYKIQTSTISDGGLKLINLPANYVLSTMINARDYRSEKNIHKCYALLDNHTLHIVYDGHEDNLWFAIWSSYKGQDDLVWVKASKECKLGTFCHDLELSSEKLLESPYHIHFYKGSDSPEKFLCAFDTPAR